MAVMTHAQNQPRTINYRTLTTTQQDRFDQLMEQADTAGTNDAYLAAMTEAVAITGIRLPASRDIAKCGCPCDCGHIFDSNADGVTVIEHSHGYNLSRLQCPDCTDEHPAPAPQ